METMGSLTTFFGWCSILNIGMLVFYSFMIMVLRDWMAGIHNKIFGITKEVAIRKYFSFVVKYKILTIIFSIVPYFALKIMS